MINSVTKITLQRGEKMLGLIIRFIVSAIVLMVVSYILPGFAQLTFGHALIAAVVIALLGFIVESFFGRKISPQNRGLVGFVVSAAIIFLAQYIVPGMTVSIIGAILAAIVIGVIDLFVPTELR